MDLSSISDKVASIDGQISDIFRALSNGFQKLEKIKDPNRQSRQLEELTGKMRDCKKLIKEFETEVKKLEKTNDSDVNKMLNEKKQFMVKELNSYVTLKKQHAKRVEMFETQGNEEDEDGLVASSMTNQQLIDSGNKMMDETDESIERSKQVVQETLNVGQETTASLKAQTDQMNRIVNELDSVNFSLKKASKLAMELGRQLATDKCIMSMLFIIFLGVISIIVVKIVHPKNKDISDIPGLAPPVVDRKLLWIPHRD
ncbi:putative plant snare [Zostera marina]|uniref:Putative plant snare n=1 Tax=Zostera marina TaxID=29655 RepID=A0A0K9NWN7_ZOSMR|nr:putative plant snare [Zostera marina]